MPVIKRELSSSNQGEAVIKPFRLPEGNQKKRKIGVLEMIPAAAVLAIMFIIPPPLEQFNTQLSKMLPFSRINEYLDEFTGREVQKPAMNIVLPSPFLVPPRRHSESTSAADTTRKAMDPAAMPQPAVSNQAPAVIDAASVFPVAGKNNAAEMQPTYHVIGGCFRSEENAAKFISEMQLKGLDARMIGKSPAGLYMVSLYHFDARPKAVRKLQEMSAENPSGAWIFPAE
jgi:hypothetical protein